MEFVSSVAESSNLIVEVMFLSDLCMGVSEDTTMVPTDIKAHVVGEVDREFGLALVARVLCEVIRLFLFKSSEHGVCVSHGVHDAHGFEVLGFFELFVRIVLHFSALGFHELLRDCEVFCERCTLSVFHNY